ncbi:MAG: PAS domain S-box protein [Bacteroidales bacterium]|nr:PAS domain S-box protein [Bacteroidales bacterium]
MKHILIIESNKNELLKLSDFLSKNNYKVTAVMKGSSGIQKILETIPDLIICDSNSGDLSGYQVFNTLKQINSTAAIPFIFTIDNNSYKEVRDVVDLEVDDYIIKPINSLELLDLIETRLLKLEKITCIADEKFSTLMDYSLYGVYIYQEDKLAYVNHKFCKIVGYSRQELIGMNLVNIIYKDDISMVIERMNRSFRDIENELHVQFRILRRDQKLLTVNLSGCIVNIDNKKSIIGNISDVEKNVLKKHIFPSDINITKV